MRFSFFGSTDQTQQKYRIIIVYVREILRSPYHRCPLLKFAIKNLLGFGNSGNLVEIVHKMAKISTIALVTNGLRWKAMEPSDCELKEFITTIINFEKYQIICIPIATFV